MKSMRAITLFAIASLATATGLLAQNRAVKVNVPFAFSAGDTWMPAGEYTVSAANFPVVQIKSTDGRDRTWILGLKGYHESKSGSMLEFDKVGNDYFLHRILSPAGSSMNIDLATGKHEKRALRLEARLTPPDETFVPAE
jgi:hypothetical protein